MVEKLRHLERRVLQPAIPHGGVAEYIDACLGGGVSREENCGGDYDRGKQAETVMWVSGVAAGVFAAGAVITAIVFSDDEPEQVGFRCAPGLGGASCSGSF